MQRNVLATLLSAVMVVSLVGCGSGQTAATQSRVSTAAAESESKSKNKDGTYSVAFICKSYSDTFCLTVKDEFERQQPIIRMSLQSITLILRIRRQPRLIKLKHVLRQIMTQLYSSKLIRKHRLKL